ncbi:alcohol dehydrogenase, partial [miscellaneous Crenarchaeota group archaeon SMTZ1-55]
MKAMVLNAISPMESQPLQRVDLPIPEPNARQMVVQIAACGVCHTELDEIEGRLLPKLPIILGHEIVGRVETLGSEVTRFTEGDRVGITWLNWACGKCAFCLAGNENLCENAKWTGKDVNGGYAQYTVIAEDFAYPIPERLTDAEAAPLLCAGVIGYRAVRLTGIHDGEPLGLYGFGASAHIVLQIAKYTFPHSPIYVFTRSQG